MKKILLIAAVVLTWASCAKKTDSKAAIAGSTTVDGLYSAEAVARQVNAVYDYLEQMREHPDEEMPSLNEKFGTREWQLVMNNVAAVDQECECGGYFDFGNEGPLDPWTYDGYEGRVRADSIKVKIQPGNTAEVRFLVKDAMTIRGVPMRWLMQVENGQWRVGNIFFERDGGLDLLLGMRAYADDGRFNADFDITKYLQEMKKQAAKPYGCEPDDIFFDSYGLIDIDLDGLPEVYVRSGEQYYSVVYSIAGGKVQLLSNSFAATEVYFFEHGVGAQGGSLEEVCRYGMNEDCGLLVNSSRGIIYASQDDHYAEIAGNKARELQQQMEKALAAI